MCCFRIGQVQLRSKKIFRPFCMACFTNVTILQQNLSSKIQPTSLKSTSLTSTNCTTLHLNIRCLITALFKAHVMSHLQEKITELSTWLHLISSCNCRCCFLSHTKPIACFLNTPSSF